MRNHYEELYTSKLENLKELHEFLNTYNLPRLNQEDTDNLNRPMEAMTLKQ